MRKLFGFILTPLHYIFFGLVLVVFHPIQWICFNWFGYRAHKWAVDTMNWWITATYYVLFNTVTFNNKQHLPLDRPMIFVANHQSLYDIPVMIWFLRKYHAKFISKIELTKGIPSVSYNLRHGGGANIDRRDPRQSIMELAKLGTRMKENRWSCVIFPEGTRSKDGAVRAFQSAGIGAILKKCPEALIVPVAIRNSWKMVRYGKYPMGTFIRMTWDVLPPIDPTGKSLDETVKEAENAIRMQLGQSS
ncbi:MAG: 1-acyl-sn-glycerol-3-phosphate acyltransferase [Bacteroidetes bacterium]|nr:1-acyl-sn-glycerol-3-phosphate acyltransferase [Bacteroidota bacterium]